MVHVKVRLQLMDDDGRILSEAEVLRMKKPTDRIEHFGLAISEAKALLAATQREMIMAQATERDQQHRLCPCCGAVRQSHSVRTWRLRTLFGNVDVPARRRKRCPCDAQAGGLHDVFADLRSCHASPELLFIESKWASLVSFGITSDLLGDVLPVAVTTNASTIRRDFHRLAKAIDAKLGPERGTFIEGCPADWARLPFPEGPINVGVDGGFVRSWEDKKAYFEVIAGKSLAEERADRYFGFVQAHDVKPRRRLKEVLDGQGLQMNQDVVFLTDGGDSVRSLVSGYSPIAEHLLDWFHISMRLTVLEQFAKGLAHHNEEEANAISERLDRIKWRLWNGDAVEALERIKRLSDDLSHIQSAYDGLKKFIRLTEEFATYISNNLDSIPDYGDRWRNGERISTAFAESAVNVVIDKRMSKRQQMQWSKAGAHLMIQIRTRTLDGTIRKEFQTLYPGLPANDDDVSNPKIPAQAA